MFSWIITCFTEETIKIPTAAASRLIFKTIPALQQDSSAWDRWTGAESTKINQVATMHAATAKARLMGVLSAMLPTLLIPFTDMPTCNDLITTVLAGETYDTEYGRVGRARTVNGVERVKDEVICLPSLGQPLKLYAKRVGVGAYSAGGAVFDHWYALLLETIQRKLRVDVLEMRLEFFFFLVPATVAQIKSFSLGDGFMHTAAAEEWKEWVLDEEVPKMGKLKELVDEYRDRESNPDYQR